MDDKQAVERLFAVYGRMKESVGHVIVGQEDVVEQMLMAIFCRGHALLVGVPGLAKTLLVSTLGRLLHLGFKRIQFTPDLMPADIIGTNIVVEDEAGNREFRFRQGPIFANIVLADEINRATPKTQSALLEAMQEHTVSVARTSHRLEEPFFVMATQNPIEMEGTYTLPEAQLDRFFFKLLVTFPTGDDLGMILDRTTQREMPHGERVMDAARLTGWAGLVRDVPVAPQITSYVVRLVTATHPESPDAPEIVKQYVRYGSSPRGAQALLLAGKVNALRAGRFNVSFSDIQKTAHSSLRHRILLNFEAEADGVSPDQLVDTLLKAVDTKAKVA